MKVLLSLAALAAICSLAPAAAAGRTPTPPAQPDRGPGGAAHRWAEMKIVFHDDADDNLDYWTYEPRQWKGTPADKPDRVPVTFFLHGFSAVNPVAYQSWIRHIVLRGNALVYPRYQATNFVPTATYTPNAIAALGSGVDWLRANAKPAPRFGQGVNVIGHSYGGSVAANVGARAREAGLPKPASMLIVNPFSSNASYTPPEPAIDPDLSGIPDGTELVCIVADTDTTTGRLGCDDVFEGIDGVERADYLWMYSDERGDPPLTVSHRSPSIASSDDAFDFFGFWKLSDALASCSLDEERCAYAIGGGARQRSLGRWSDGVPVRPMDAFRSPPACPPASTAYGC